jgi:phenylacetic acid degradation operon negative regulatory protein
MKAETHPQVVRKLIEDFRVRRPMRTTSLIVSLFGDVVSQHGNVIWLGSLLAALDPLGVNPRLVRTSVFRLVKDGWLESERVGRRSYYRFSAFGLHEYERAARRIYALEQREWHGRWLVLIPLAVPENRRDGLRRSLWWQGFRAITPGTYARPGDSDPALLETLDEFGASDQVLLMESNTAPSTSARMLSTVVQDSWKLDDVAAAYRQFMDRFRPLQKFLGSGRELQPSAAFVVRILLVHDYRRVLLRDTPLPQELLPKAWPGESAKLLISGIYHALAEPSLVYIRNSLEAGNGFLPAPKPEFYRRFSSS